MTCTYASHVFRIILWYSVLYILRTKSVKYMIFHPFIILLYDQHFLCFNKAFLKRLNFQTAQEIDFTSRKDYFNPLKLITKSMDLIVFAKKSFKHFERIKQNLQEKEHSTTRDLNPRQ